MNAENHVTATVAEDGREVVVTIRDRREHIRDTLLAEDGRDHERATAAWTVGTAALHQACGLAASAQLDEVGTDLLNTVDEQLSAWTNATTSRLAEELKTYFDPDSGELSARLGSFLADDGELAAVLRAHVSPEESVLATTLAQTVGAHSPVFRLLDPDHAQGVVQQLEKRIGEVLRERNQGFVTALDPAVPTSPLARFLADLQERLKRSAEDRESQLRTIAAQLDAGDDGSLLSQLVRRTGEAQRDLREAINPERPGSPLAVVRDSLVRLLTEATEEQRRTAKESRTSQEQFQHQVIEFLTEARARRGERDRSPAAGRDFEAALLDFVASSVAGAPIACDPCGTRTGAVSGRKVGDIVLRFTDESAYAGSGVVIEAKRDGSYSVARILEEAALARQNRLCGASVFVIAAERAPAGVPRFARHGQDVIVVWSPDDDDLAAYLHAALQLGLALAAMDASEADPKDLEALGELEERIGLELRRLATVDKHCETIERAVAKVRHEASVGRKKLGVMLERAQSAMRAVRIDRPRMGPDGRVAPVVLPHGSLEFARGTAKRAEGAAK